MDLISRCLHFLKDEPTWTIWILLKGSIVQTEHTEGGFYVIRGVLHFITLFA